MFNTYNYNTTVYNGLGITIPTVSSDKIIFNSYSLQSADIISQILLQDSTPDRDFDTVGVPRGHGQIITGDFWRKKRVKVSGIIKKPTNELLEIELDAMKKALGVGEAYLDITIAGVVRRYKATLVNGSNLFEQRKGYHITVCPFQAEFECSTPFGESVDYQTIGFLDNSDLAFIEQANNDGTVEAKPVIIVSFSAANSVTAVSFKNNSTGEEIKITQNFVAGDYLRFDSELLSATVNGSEVDYDGAFPSFKTGANNFTLTITGTSATYDLTVKHKTPFL